MSLSPQRDAVCNTSLHSFPAGHASLPPPHSLPTRRSSDLPHVAAVDPVLDRRGFGTLADEEVPGPFREQIGKHTSELQSPDHLVCRLLLEKKKLTVTTPAESIGWEISRTASHEPKQVPSQL